MPQIKTKRKQDKIFKKVKLVSFLACIFVTLAILDLVYKNYILDRDVLSPLSTRTSNQIEASLRQKNVIYKKLEEHSNYYVLVLQGGEAVLISKNKDIVSQLSSLQLIQSRLKIEGKDFKSLDLRFAQPVIK